ncbi:hypothetical protein Tco_0215549 [Tanacetum coccineum]
MFWQTPSSENGKRRSLNGGVGVQSDVEVSSDWWSGVGNELVKGRRIVPGWILRLANDRVGWDKYPWGSYVWPTLYSQLKDANIRRWPSLYASQPIDQVDKKTYSIFGFTWTFKTWILESFRVTTTTYYNRHSRYPRAADWSKKGRFLRRMVVDFFHGNLHVARLTPDDIEARSEWWVSSRAYFDGVIDQAEREDKWRRDGWNTWNKEWEQKLKKKEESKALVTVDVASGDWKSFRDVEILFNGLAQLQDQKHRKWKATHASGKAKDFIEFCGLKGIKKGIQTNARIHNKMEVLKKKEQDTLLKASKDHAY